MVQATVAFVPSPLLPESAFFGPLMRALGERGRDCVATSLGDEGTEAEPWHERHVRNAAAGLGRRMWPGRRYVLVGYSGSGPLLPYIAEGYGERPEGYVFMDAGLPHPGRSRLDEVRASVPEAAGDEMAEYLAGGGAWPAWSDEDLSPLVTDGTARRALLDMVVPRSGNFWTEPMPGLGLWPDARVGYLRLSHTYEGAASDARSRGWVTRAVDGTHFDPFAQEGKVAEELVALLAEMGC